MAEGKRKIQCKIKQINQNQRLNTTSSKSLSSHAECICVCVSRINIESFHVLFFVFVLIKSVKKFCACWIIYILSFTLSFHSMLFSLLVLLFCQSIFSLKKKSFFYRYDLHIHNTIVISFLLKLPTLYQKKSLPSLPNDYKTPGFIIWTDIDGSEKSEWKRNIVYHFMVNLCERILWLWGHYDAYLFVHELSVLKMGFEICNGFGSAWTTMTTMGMESWMYLRRIICNELLWEIFSRYNVDGDDDKHETKSERFFSFSITLNITVTELKPC